MTTSKRTCVIFQSIFLHFSGILADQRPISLPPVIASAISHLSCFSMILNVLLLLHRWWNYIYSHRYADISLPSYRFRRLHCHCKIVTWMFLDLAATSSSLNFASCFFKFFRTTWINSTLVKVTMSLFSVHIYLLIISSGFF